MTSRQLVGVGAEQLSRSAMPTPRLSGYCRAVDRNQGDELAGILDRWDGRPVAVRVVAAGDELLAVFAGTIGPRSAAKGSSLFWPVDTGACDETTLEQSGIYVRRELLSEVRVHTGGYVVEFTQAGTTVNVRRLVTS